MFDLDLNRASTLGHDALARDGRPVKTKLTQGQAWPSATNRAI